MNTFHLCLRPEWLPVLPPLSGRLVVLLAVRRRSRLPHREESVQRHRRSQDFHPHRQDNVLSATLDLFCCCLWDSHTQSDSVRRRSGLECSNAAPCWCGCCGVTWSQPSLPAGLLPPAAFLVAVSYAGCSHILTVTFLTLSTTVAGISASGVFINQLDIAPRWVIKSNRCQDADIDNPYSIYTILLHILPVICLPDRLKQRFLGGGNSPQWL